MMFAAHKTARQWLLFLRWLRRTGTDGHITPSVIQSTLCGCIDRLKRQQVCPTYRVFTLLLWAGVSGASTPEAAAVIQQ